MRFTYTILVFLAFACNSKQKPSHLPAIKAMAETEAVSANIEDDAADDPAIWYNRKDPESSLIFGSNKTRGIDMYDLKGNLLKTYEVGRINNIDCRSIVLDSLQVHILGGSNRSTNSIDFWSINDSAFTLNSLGNIKSQLPDVYGFCLYKNERTGELSAFVNSKTGKVEQWLVSYSNGIIEGNLSRSLQLPGQVEGMVADDYLETLFIGVEEGGIFKFGANAENRDYGELLADSDAANPNIEYDIEGLAIYYAEDDSGYLLASIQGNFSYAVYERSGSHRYLGGFTLIDGNVDGVEETDGIDISHYSFGKEYPSGIFVCQDGYNYDNGEMAPQNFKIVNWQSIQEAIDSIRY